MRNLSRLLNPKSIAVIGGGAWCTSIIVAAHQIGFEGILRPVHPSGKIIAGIPSLPSLDQFPGPIDAAFIGVNRHATLDIVTQLRSCLSWGLIVMGFLTPSMAVAFGQINTVAAKLKTAQPF
jgi:acyl-CoA synthetase (NDP forming)